jgi:hypothetical protein
MSDILRSIDFPDISKNFKRWAELRPGYVGYVHKIDGEYTINIMEPSSTDTEFNIVRYDDRRNIDERSVYFTTDDNYLDDNHKIGSRTIDFDNVSLDNFFKVVDRHLIVDPLVHDSIVDPLVDPLVDPIVHDHLVHDHLVHDSIVVPLVDPIVHDHLVHDSLVDTLVDPIVHDSIDVNNVSIADSYDSIFEESTHVKFCHQDNYRNNFLNLPKHSLLKELILYLELSEKSLPVSNLLVQHHTLVDNTRIVLPNHKKAKCVRFSI